MSKSTKLEYKIKKNRTMESEIKNTHILHINNWAMFMCGILVKLL